MPHKPKPTGNALTATLAGVLMIAACAIVGESIELERQTDQITLAEASAAGCLKIYFQAADDNLSLRQQLAAAHDEAEAPPVFVQ